MRKKIIFLAVIFLGSNCSVFAYSTESEIAMGANIHRRIAVEYKLSNNPKDIERVSKLGEKIVKVCQRQEFNYYFYVINDEKIKNAFCIPGGYVYVFKGLIDMLDDQELAYVIAHELGHVNARHNIKRLEGSMGAALAAIAAIFVPSDSPDFARGVQFALGQILSGYSRQDELEADSLAANYLKQSDFDATASVRALEKLYNESKKTIYPIQYFKTHPYVSERIGNIRQTLHLPISVNDYMNK